jgi:hypothetical protein
MKGGQQEPNVMSFRAATLASIMAACAACCPAGRLSPASGAPTPGPDSVYGNPQYTTDPLDPSNKGRNPRVVEADGNADDTRPKAAWFDLKPGSAPLYDGTGKPMGLPHEPPVVAKDRVNLNYGMRLERGGRTYYMA